MGEGKAACGFEHEERVEMYASPSYVFSGGSEVGNAGLSKPAQGSSSHALSRKLVASVVGFGFFLCNAIPVRICSNIYIARWSESFIFHLGHIILPYHICVETRELFGVFL